MTTLVLAAAAAFAFLAIGPHVFGYRTTMMTTAGPAPGIDPGDVVVSVPVTVADVRVGDVITYEVPAGDHRTVTRSVVSVDHDAAGRVSLLTRGEAGTAVDATLVALPGDTAWRTTHVVHHLGDAVRVLRGAAPQTWVLWGAVGLAALTGLTGLTGAQTRRTAGSTRKERINV